MLIVLGGLPGTGKTTIGKELAARRAAVYVRVDEIEHAMRSSLASGDAIGASGYAVACAVASSNLRLGNWVVADSVNPVPEGREAWRRVAQSGEGALVLEVEVVCSDIEEHRRRVEARVSDIQGFRLPSWELVKSHGYVPLTDPRMVVDTARSSAVDVVAAIERRIATMTVGE